MTRRAPLHYVVDDVASTCKLCGGHTWLAPVNYVVDDVASMLNSALVSGLYTIEVGRHSAHFIIMNYWFATMHEIQLRYDLKGSTSGRRASKKEKQKARPYLSTCSSSTARHLSLNPHQL